MKVKVYYDENGIGGTCAIFQNNEIAVKDEKRNRGENEKMAEV